MSKPVHVVGGGLAGSEAAWQIARRGVAVVLHEMRPRRMTDAHKTAAFAELVCSNSFRSDDRETNAVGLLHEEMRRLGSLIMQAGDSHQVPAGGALAVDRDGFAAAVTAAIERHPLIKIERAEVAGLPPEDWDSVIIATGPLTSPALADAIRELTGEAELAFFDAIAPIVHRDSIDLSVAWFQSRYDKAGPGGSGADYINCPLTREQYGAFIDALIAGEKVAFHDWEASTPYFDGCLPIEIMAERGRETLRHGPMKPVGLTNPHRPEEKPYAVVQLRQDNKLGTLFNMVGLSDQAEARRAGCASFAPSRRSKARSSRGSAACTAIRSSTRRSCWTRTLRLKRDAAAALCRPDHRLRRLRRIRGDRPAGGPLRRRRAPGRAGARCRRRPRRTARSSATSPAATSRRSTPARARSSR